MSNYHQVREKSQSMDFCHWEIENLGIQVPEQHGFIHYTFVFPRHSMNPKGIILPEVFYI